MDQFAVSHPEELLRSTRQNDQENLQRKLLAVFIESILLVIGIETRVVSYGQDVATPFMQIGIVIGLVLGGILKLSVRNPNTQSKEVLASIFSLIHVFLCSYYLLEDQFEFTFD